MQIARNVISRKGLTAVMGVFTAVWLSLEGRLWSVVVMGVGWTAVALLYLVQKYVGGRVVTGWRWWVGTAVTGFLMGLGSGVLTLVFMTIKTGLHAHGPEFTPDQIIWLMQQTPIWTAAGLFAGLGLGLLTVKN